MIDQATPRTMQVPGAGLIPNGRPTIDYKEYPKMMTHPQYRPGKPTPPMKHEAGFTFHGIGEPIRFPPVLVKTQRDEEYHAAQGYLSQGKCDAAAFDRAVGAGKIPDATVYKVLEYPKWVLGKLCNDLAAENAWLVQNGQDPVGVAADAAPPEINTEVATLLDRPDLAQAEIKAAVIAEVASDERLDRLEASVDHLTELLAGALKALTPKIMAPTKADIEDGYELVKKLTAPRQKAAPAKKKAAAPLNQEQKQARSEAIKAGMARRREAAEKTVDGNPADPGA